MTATSVRVTREGGAVVRITLDGDAQLNALAPSTMEELRAALADASADETASVVVLTGTGRAFCTGADLARLPPDRDAVMAAAGAVIEAVVDCEVPVVVVVQGPAAGYGVSLVAAADVALAAGSATFSLPFTGIGVMPDGGLTHTLPAAIGRALAAELVLSGRAMPASEAAAAGLVSRVLPDDRLTAAADALVERIAVLPRRALTLTKQALHASDRAPLADALAREHVGQVELLDSPDFTRLTARWLR